MQEIIFKKVRSLGGKGKKKKSDQAIDKKKNEKKVSAKRQQQMDVLSLYIYQRAP